MPSRGAGRLLLQIMPQHIASQELFCHTQTPDPATDPSILLIVLQHMPSRGAGRLLLLIVPQHMPSRGAGKILLLLMPQHIASHGTSPADS